MMTLRVLWTVAVLLGSLAAAGANASIIDSTLGEPRGWHPFGVREYSYSQTAATYGQSFHVGATDTVVDSFSLYLIGSATLDVRGYIGAWNGNTVTSLLYSSPTVAAPVGTGTHELSFSPGGLHLDANSDYIAFLSIAGLPAPSGLEYLPLASDTIAGNFFYMRDDTSIDQLSGPNWYSWLSYDAWLKVDLSAPQAVAAVPEPSSLMLLGLALAGIGISRRRAKPRS